MSAAVCCWITGWGIDGGSTAHSYPFGEQSVLIFLQGSGNFHRSLMLARSVWASRERLGASAKEIAAECGLTPVTVHQYAVGLQRKFGVRGRVGLLTALCRAHPY